jgi:hypothetical protein
MYESAYHPKLYSVDTEKDYLNKPQKGQRTAVRYLAQPGPGKNETRNAYQILLMEVDHLFSRDYNRNLKIPSVPRADVITAQHQAPHFRTLKANKTVPTSHTTVQVLLFPAVVPK